MRPRTMLHTCMMLSSATEQMTIGSFGFHEKSDTLLVWPPWMNWPPRRRAHQRNARRFGFKHRTAILRTLAVRVRRTSNSGGPSSSSSGACSSPMREMSQTCTRRSTPADARYVSLCGDHASCPPGRASQAARAALSRSAGWTCAGMEGGGAPAERRPCATRACSASSGGCAGPRARRSARSGGDARQACAWAW